MHINSWSKLFFGDSDYEPTILLVLYAACLVEPTAGHTLVINTISILAILPGKVHRLAPVVPAYFVQWYMYL